VKAPSGTPTGEYAIQFSQDLLDVVERIQRGQMTVPDRMWLDGVEIDPRAGRGCQECWRQDGKHNSRCPNRSAE